MNLDLLIFSAFLFLSLILGIISSKKVTNISEYAVGNRDFATSTLVATLVATWIGGGFFSYTLIETYRQGLYFLIPSIGDFLVLILVASIFAPRMGEFLGKLSIAESMGEMFGSKVRLITATFSIIRSIGALGVQFKISSKIMELIFDTSGTFATLSSASIVIIYSALGGIRAVTFTDIIQFFTFGCLLPIVAIIVWQTLGDGSGTMVWQTLATNPLFDIKSVFDLQNPKFYTMLGLCAWFIIPEFSPATFQRISMARSVGQAIRSYKVAALLCLLVQCIVITIGIFILSDNPNVNPDDLVKYIISHYSYISGFKGIIAIGIMAMVMSTADSSINSLSVIFAHDIVKPLGFKWGGNELLVARIATIFSGIMAIFFALKSGSILDLIRSILGLYLPVVTIPFLFAILGFRSSGKSVLAAAGGSLFVIFIWKNFLTNAPIDSLFPGIFTSIVFLFGTHYLFKQPGGWVGIKDFKTYQAISSARYRLWHKVLHNITKFDFITFCSRNTPNNTNIYFYFGLFTIISTVLNILSMPPLKTSYNNIVSFCYISALTLACYLITYPVWPKIFKNRTFISIFWTLSSVYMSIFINSIFLFISNAAQIQMAIFFLNITAVLLIFRWNVALLMLLIGFAISIGFINSYLQLQYLNIMDIKFQLLFCLLLLSSFLIAFLRPTQEAYDKNVTILLEQSKTIRNISEQMLNSLIIRQEFINNVNHEIRTPIHHIGAYLEELDQSLHTSSVDKTKESFDMLKQGYQRLKDYMNDILDLSDLSNNSVELKYENINLHTLVFEVVDKYTKLHLNNSDLQIYVNCLTKNVIISCDKDKMIQVLNNLIKNAVQFSPKGTIEINLSDTNMWVGHKRIMGIMCSIVDEGIGIPEDEMTSVFGPFIQSSHTKNISGGKGLGLALCEHIIKLHKGAIWAENNLEKKGVTFSFTIPTSIDKTA